MAAVNLNSMATNIKNVLAAVPGMAAAYDHEPQELNPLPAATIYFDGFNERENTLGNIDYNWNWTIRIYIPINTTDIQAPQLLIRTITTDTLKTFRAPANIQLNGSCLYSNVTAGDIYNILNATNPLMVAELTLVAATRESR
jgi:hypothetical protein